ncbi:MAG: hypothetical protein U0T75_08230 [Chitinophagales bacterium]
MKHLFILLVGVCISVNARSSEIQYNHCIDGGYTGRLFGDPSLVLTMTFVPTVTYTPKFNFFNTPHISLTLGTPVGIGAGLRYGTGLFAAWFYTNASAMLDLNYGAGSSLQNNQKMGFFIGGGFQDIFQRTLIYSDGKYLNNLHFYGPGVNAGLRFNMNLGSIGFKMSYCRDLNYHSHIAALMVQYTFGKKQKKSAVPKPEDGPATEQ